MDQPKRRMTRYKVSTRREVPVDGRSWTAIVDLEVACPNDAVIETHLTDLRVRLVESSPGSRVANLKPQPLEGPSP